MTTLVSIIIPTYNRAHLINETLDSIMAQTYTNWECIVVDDGSTDNTPEVIEIFKKKDKRFKFYSRPKNRKKGASACRNYGFELSKGDYINWFDDDDIMHPDKLKIQMEALSRSIFNFSVCQSLVFDKSIKNIIGLRHGSIYSNQTLKDYISRAVIWMTPSALWKKSFLETFDKLFDENLQAAQEWEFHCRALFFSPGYQVCNKPLIYLRKHSDSISYNNDVEKRDLNYYLARDKIYYFLKEKGVRSDFLSLYFISCYKNALKKKQYSFAFSELLSKIINNKYILVTCKLKLMTSFFIYRVFNKGEFLFKGNYLKQKTIFSNDT
ncbi:glycosyltransferase family 2 protein [Changchengzhania lutea]|uniref:glycosyltransferase family 2 protein n=1 Tax=Changchengzhania lutea TaxID=2049305 RepID=UPI00115E97D5|nr:glycosyltransferase family 2 protein [Changchengzhania lutea]